MSDGKHSEELASKAADTVRGLVADAEARAEQIVSEAEAEASRIREQANGEAADIRRRAEADARGQIEAAKRALDELGGTLAAAASAAIPPTESTPTEPDTQPEPELADQDASPAGNGDDAAERLLAMKLAVQGEDPAAIESMLVEKFGPGDRSALLKDVLARAQR